MFPMWTSGTYSTKLFQSFKRVIGTVTDGTVSQFQKIPSTPLIVTLQVNGKSIDAMIDTGSSTTIISRTLLYKLIHRPRIKFKRNTYRTASNTNLCTIGLVQLKVNIEEIPTFVLAEISADLCTELVLGNDWITANGIDIITTQRHIRKCNGSQTATVPFNSNTKRDHMVSPIERFNRVDKPHGHTSPSTMVNISESPSQSNATPAQSESTCRVCFEVFSTKRCLFAHLGVSGHYAEEKIDGSIEQLPPFVYDHINQSIQHIDNPRDRKKVQSTLVKYASVFDTSKATTIQSIVKHTIEVNNSRPIVQRPYRKTEEQETAITNLCQAIPSRQGYSALSVALGFARGVANEEGYIVEVLSRLQEFERCHGERQLPIAPHSRDLRRSPGSEVLHQTGFSRRLSPDPNRRT